MWENKTDVYARGRVKINVLWTLKGRRYHLSLEDKKINFMQKVAFEFYREDCARLQYQRWDRRQKLW